MSKINKLFAIFLSTLLVTFSANSVEVKFGHGKTWFIIFSFG